MELTVTKTDSANAVATALISKVDLNKTIDTLAKRASKDMKVDGFRKGKVPVAVVKSRYADKLEEDAKSDAVRKMFQDALSELEIDQSSVMGEPAVTKFDEKEEGIDVEIKIALRPTINLEGYKELVPDLSKPEVTDEEVKERLDGLLKSSAPLKNVEEDRELISGDYALIDFEGFVDGEAFDGGKGENYTLQIGSNSFIPGFEDALIGMKKEEQRDINVTFPENYQAEHLKGKPAVFKVKLHSIQEKETDVKVDDEVLAKFLPGEENPSEELLNEKIKEQIETEKTHKLYHEDIKPKYVDALVEKYNFDLPQNIVEQELDISFRNALQNFSEEEMKQMQEDVEKLKEKRETYRDDAIKSVKLTFIVDELSKIEGVSVSDQEVMQTIYYEAFQYGQDPQKAYETYQKNGYLPAVKMAMTEDKLFAKLFDEKIKD